MWWFIRWCVTLYQSQTHNYYIRSTKCYNLSGRTDLHFARITLPLTTSGHTFTYPLAFVFCSRHAIFQMEFRPKINEGIFSWNIFHFRMVPCFNTNAHVSYIYLYLKSFILYYNYVTMCIIYKWDELICGLFVDYFTWHAQNNKLSNQHRMLKNILPPSTNIVTIDITQYDKTRATKIWSTYCLNTHTHTQREIFE